ncbi:non-canonical purine NTP pyrophosphatase [Candidatus Saccharibacteria bacterium]|nr:non-canonical purine NTP pyrophosphatase [Candidatus Saccharibacteria bacterium]
MNDRVLHFITTNDFKFKSAREALEDAAFSLRRLNIGTPELQSDSTKTVAEYSAEWAANTYNKPVITEDVGMYIEALKGFPGPFLSQVENQIGAEGFLRLLDGKPRMAHWEYAVAYCEPGERPVSFAVVQQGAIAQTMSGNIGWDMGKIFIPEGQSKTISVLLEEQGYVRNNGHYTALKKYLHTLYLHIGE